MSSGPSFSLGVSGIESPHTPHYSLGVPGLEQPHSPSYSFGVAGSEPAHTFFGVASSDQLMQDMHSRKSRTFKDFLEAGPPKASDSIVELTVDVATDLTHLHKLSQAMSIGKGLHEGAEAVKESERPKMEAVVCQTAKVGTEILVEEVGSKIIVGGVPLLIAASIADPLVALAIPVAGAALPQAYANMQHLAKFAGEKAEEECHELFSGK